MTERRSFIKKLLAGAVVLNYAPELLQANKTTKKSLVETLQEIKPIRIALIGKGGMGTADANTALSVEGVKIVAVCDLYDKRLENAKKEWGNNLFTTKEYKEILQREDVDVILIGTPDHWHQRIAIDALKAGKHVYCEKPVIHKIAEAKELIDVQKVSGCYFQAGSQGMASLGNRKAHQLVMSGILGKINYIEAKFTSSPGIPGNYPVPEDASDKTIWWDRFLGKAPKHSFEAQRFFYWRNWKDYGTGIAGDLFVHVLASVHYITNASGPNKILSTGDIRYYTDGFRDTPDIMLGYFDYPDRNNIGSFTLSLSANMEDGISNEWGSTYFKIVGNNGILEVGWDKVKLRTLHQIDTAILDQLPPLGLGIDKADKKSGNEFIFQANNEYKGGHYDHFLNFFTGIRNKTPLTADVMFGVQSAAPALLCYESYLREAPIYWDAQAFKEIKRKKRA